MINGFGFVDIWVDTWVDTWVETWVDIWWESDAILMQRRKSLTAKNYLLWGTRIRFISNVHQFLNFPSWVFYKGKKGFLNGHWGLRYEKQTASKFLTPITEKLRGSDKKHYLLHCATWPCPSREKTSLVIQVITRKHGHDVWEFIGGSKLRSPFGRG